MLSILIKPFAEVSSIDNGWFLFACMGLLFDRLRQWGVQMTHGNRIFWLFAGAVIPAYFLSTLWMELPLWIYIIILAAVAQAVGWTYFIVDIRFKWIQIKQHLGSLSRWLFILSALALSIKLFLQLGSLIPSMSTLAFGIRSIVVGYLHLSLLGVITLFLIGYIANSEKVNLNKAGSAGVIIFIIGVIANEFFLAMQGTMAMGYIVIPGINLALLCAALLFPRSGVL